MPRTVRGCGTRKAGGVYLETSLSPVGRPLDDFLLCPPIPVAAEELRIEPRGVSLIERPGSDGVFDVYDWVGSTHYPNVADVIAEARRHGISRRISKRTSFAKLTSRSRLVLLHSRAIIENAWEYRRLIRNEQLDHGEDGAVPLRTSCPKNVPDHRAIFLGGATTGEYSNAMCHALYYDDIEGGEIVLDPGVPWRTVDRTIGDTTYRARRRPEVAPEYGLGIFAILPIGKITVIRDPAGGTHEKPLWDARQAGLNVELEEE